MFTAKDTETQQEIIILAPSWVKQVKKLRLWAHHNRLVCPVCSRLVTVKAGTSRRWHFAHRHKADCDYGEDDPVLSSARAVLYSWLAGKFGEEVVSLEKPLYDERLPRPVDCWVKHPQRDIAYWLIHKNVRPAERIDVQTVFSDMCAKKKNRRDTHIHWVFLKNMLRIDKEAHSRVYLNPTEREFMQRTRYDSPAHELPELDRAAQLGLRGGQSLHYLETPSESITTYRGLILYHEPQAFDGIPVTTPLSELLVSPHTGEFVHPGEYQRAKAFEAFQEQVKKRREDIEKEEVDRRQRYHARLETGWDHRMQAPQAPTLATTQPQGSLSSSYFTKPTGVCVYCGEKTTDWWQYDGKDGTCSCRPCRDKGLS